MDSKVEQGGIRSARDRVIKEVSAQQLESGKWQGIYTHLVVNPVGNTEIEMQCKGHRETKEEALNDAKVLSEKR
jgi:hypothetical protein